MSRLIALFLFSCLLFCYSCTKEEIIKEPEPIADWEEKCENIPPFKGITGYQRNSLGTQYTQPFVYPDNPSKILFLRKNLETSKNRFELVEYNFTTNSEKVLIKDRLINYPKVNKRGDIIFFDYGFNIYIYSNNELKKVTSSGENSFPIWGVDGNSYSHSVQVGNEDFCYIFKDLEHNAYDTFFHANNGCVGSSVDINSNNIMCAEVDRREEYGIGIIDLNTKEREKIYTKGFGDDGRAELNCVRWHPSNQFIYFSDGYGLFRVNINSKQIDTIAKGCDTHLYESFSFTPDGKHIYVERINSRKVDEHNIDKKSRIYKMDADGKNIERVF